MRRLVLICVALSCALHPAAGRASTTQESTFQDDPRLVFGSADTVNRTLATLAGLGVDRVRVSVFWRAVAPGAATKRRPAFDATDPGAYPASGWARYDRLLTAIRAHGMQFSLDVTAPAPLWATGTPERSEIEQTFRPDPVEFGSFVRAVARRYDGTYVPAAAATAPRVALPRADHWEIYNEPNQAGWLTPQWVSKRGRFVEAAPSLYRGLLDAAYAGLAATGHGADTILVGSTAPKGLSVKGTTRAIKPLVFVRRLYCLDDRDRPLRGTGATDRGCPATPNVAAFRAAHPALFEATGWAHHPYELAFAPSLTPRDRDFVTIANLPRLSSALRGALGAYGVRRSGGTALFLTEFGYQTDPPDRYGVTPAQQAAYLNESEFIAYANPQVRSLNQFLLTDDGGDIGRTFQSGLRFASGAAKPALAAYRLPIFLPRRTFSRGTSVRVWGLVRAASGAQPVAVEFRPSGAKAYRRVATLRSDAVRGYVDRNVHLPASGSVRLRWRDERSRAVSVRRR